MNGEDIHLDSLFQYVLPPGKRQEFLEKLIDTNSSFPYKADDDSDIARNFKDAFSNYPVGAKEFLKLTQILKWLSQNGGGEYKVLRDTSYVILKDFLNLPNQGGGKRRRTNKSKGKRRSKSKSKSKSKRRH